MASLRAADDVAAQFDTGRHAHRHLHESLSKHFGTHGVDFVHDVDAPVSAPAFLKRDAGLASTNTTPMVEAVPNSWGLDRIDQRARPLDGIFHYPHLDGAGVDLYVVDTGVYDNGDLTGRLVQEYTVYSDATDCNGHGTFVAGTAAGSRFGAAKQATVRSVRVLDCTGSGTVSGVAEGLDAIVSQSRAAHRRPGVINMSLATIGYNAVLAAAVANCLDAGFFVTAAAGNQAVDACATYPAASPGVVSVGCSDDTDSLCYFSNYGPCVDVLAPGASILGDYIGGAGATATLSGTSMSAPLVAGFGAVVLSASDAANYSTVVAQLLGLGTTGAISDLPSGTPNLLLFLPPYVNLTAVAESSPAGGTTTTAATSASNGATTAASATSAALRASPPLLLLLFSLLLRMFAR